MHKTTVALARCEHYRAADINLALQRQLERLGGLDRFIKSGDRVLVKPNLIAPRPAYVPTQTHPTVIIEIARLLKDFGARPFVGDSPAWGNVFSCARAIDLMEPLKKMGVPLRALDHPQACRLSDGRTTIGLSRVALEADAIINLPKFKSHQQMTFTFAVKNMFGCVSGKKKPFWHFARGTSPDRFSELLIRIFQYINPCLTIIDAVTAMQGPGPINGFARPLGWLIAGTDPTACEIICAQLVNVPAQDIPIIRTAQRLGFGCCDRQHIEIAGDDPTGLICTDFQIPDLVPVRFSLPRVLKSIAKGMVVSLRNWKLET